MRLLAEKVTLRQPTSQELKAAVGDKPRFFVDLLLALIDKRNGNKHRLKRAQVDAAIARLKDRHELPGNLDHDMSIISGTSSKIYVKDAKDFAELWLEGVYWRKRLTDEQIQKINAKYEAGTLGASWEIDPYKVVEVKEEDVLDIEDFEFSGFGIMVDSDPAEEATRGSITITASQQNGEDNSSELTIEDVTKQLGDMRTEIMMEVRTAMEEKEIQAKLDEQKKALDAEFDARLAKALEAQKEAIVKDEKAKMEVVMADEIQKAVDAAMASLKGSLEIGYTRMAEVSEYETIDTEKYVEEMIAWAKMDEKDYKIKLLELENAKLKAGKDDGKDEDKGKKNDLTAGKKDNSKNEKFDHEEVAILSRYGGI